MINRHVKDISIKDYAWQLNFSVHNYSTINTAIVCREGLAVESINNYVYITVTEQNYSAINTAKYMVYISMYTQLQNYNAIDTARFMV